MCGRRMRAGGSGEGRGSVEGKGRSGVSRYRERGGGRNVDGWCIQGREEAWRGKLSVWRAMQLRTSAEGDGMAGGSPKEDEVEGT